MMRFADRLAVLDVHTHVQNYVQTVENFVKSGLVRQRNARLHVQKSISGYFSRQICEHAAEKMNFFLKRLDIKNIQKARPVIVQKMSGILRHFREIHRSGENQDVKKPPSRGSGGVGREKGGTAALRQFNILYAAK